MVSCSRTGNTLGVHLLGLLLCWPAALPAAGARLVLDANQGPANELAGYPPPVELWSFHNRALFLVDVGQPEYGSLPRRSPGPKVQLWASDGTPGGTQLLAWFCLAPVEACQFGRARFWGESGGAVLFEVGSALWRTDGTPQGTFRLHSPLCSFESYPPEPTEILFSGRFYFSAWQPASGCELWRTDGSIEGTVPSADVLPGPDGSGPRGFVAYRGRFYFGARLETSSYDDYALWASDGTEHGTSPVFQARFVTLLTVGGGKLFFQVWQTALRDTTALWVSDGTETGTSSVQRFPDSCSLYCYPVIWFLVPAANGVVFVADDGEHNDQLWASDGTRAGTRRLTALEGPYPTAPNIFGWQGSTVPEAFASAGSTTLIAVNRGGDGATSQLWSSRGTPSSTAQLAGCPGGCPRVHYAFHRLPGGQRILMSGKGRKQLGFELWTSDGTPQGTQLLRDLCPGLCSSFPSSFVTVGQAVYFSALDEQGLALWKTDGTEAGTLRLGSAHLPYRPGMTAAAGRIFFGASSAAGTEGLWVTDGTPRGTQQIAAFGAPAASSNPQIARLGERALFTAFDGRDQALWTSDGSPEGTRQLATAPALFDNLTPDVLRVPVIAGGRAFSLVGQRDSQFGDTLFRARLIRVGATPEGTRVISDFGETFVSHPFEFRGRLAFLRCGKHHLPLSSRRFCAFWASDGTAKGTVKLFDFPYPVDFVYQPVAIGSSFFFAYSYGPAAHFLRSDGMRAFPLATLDGPSFGEFGGEIVAVGGKVFFTYAGRLWRSDGTSEGTTPLLTDEPEIVVDGGLAELDGRLLFFGTIKEEPPRSGLWSTDGTRQETVLLREQLQHSPVFSFDHGAYFRIGG